MIWHIAGDQYPSLQKRHNSYEFPSKIDGQFPTGIPLLTRFPFF